MNDKQKILFDFWKQHQEQILDLYRSSYFTYQFFIETKYNVRIKDDPITLYFVRHNDQDLIGLGVNYNIVPYSTDECIIDPIIDPTDTLAKYISNYIKENYPLDHLNNQDSDQDQNQDNNQDQNQDNNQDQNQDQNQDPDQDNNQDQNQDNNQDQNQDNNQDQNQDNNQDQNQDQNRDNNQDPDQDNNQDQNQDNNQDQNQDQNQDPDQDNNQDQNQDGVKDKRKYAFIYPLCTDVTKGIHYEISAMSVNIPKYVNMYCDICSCDLNIYDYFCSYCNYDLCKNCVCQNKARAKIHPHPWHRVNNILPIAVVPSGAVIAKILIFNVSP